MTAAQPFMVLDFHQYSHSKVNFYWNVMYSRGRKDIHVGELLLLNIAACCGVERLSAVLLTCFFG